jgi:hypothetical protein
MSSCAKPCSIRSTADSDPVLVMSPPEQETQELEHPRRDVFHQHHVCGQLLGWIVPVSTRTTNAASMIPMTSRNLLPLITTPWA